MSSNLAGRLISIPMIIEVLQIPMLEYIIKNYSQLENDLALSVSDSSSSSSVLYRMLSLGGLLNDLVHCPLISQLSLELLYCNFVVLNYSM
jgi:hypothetical protein